MSLEGTEMAVKLAGTGAKELAVLLYSVLKDQKKTKGKIRLTNMLRSGKELKVFAVKDDELAKFCKEAKRYGVLYTVIKNKGQKDGYTDIFVRAEDASKVNRIFERFKLATVDMGTVKSDIEKERTESTPEKENAERTTGTQRETRADGKKDTERADEKEDKERPMREQAENRKEDPEGVVSEKDDVDKFLDDILKTDNTREDETKGNPTEGRTKESRQSGPSSERKQTSERDTGERSNERRSVRKEMNDIRKEQARKNLDPSKTRNGKSQTHKAPKRKKRRKVVR